jgi:hypothetical protein
MKPFKRGTDAYSRGNHTKWKYVLVKKKYFDLKRLCLLSIPYPVINPIYFS